MKMIKKKIKRVTKRKNTEIYLTEIRMRKENMEETDTVICLKKRKEKKKNIKKLIVRLKSLNIKINKTELEVHAVIYAN